MTQSHKLMIQDIIDDYKEFCKYKEWRQEEAAQAIGCCRSHLSKIFSGKRNPSMALLERMEEVMKNGK